MSEIPKDLHFLHGDINKSVDWYLMASYLYYIEYESLLLDSQYDRLCRFMLNNWDDIEHPLKGMIELEDLSAGTGFTITKEQYPVSVRTEALYRMKLKSCK